MRSLKYEAECLQKQSNRWFDSVHKRKFAQTTSRMHKRTGIEKGKLFGDDNDDDVIELEINPSCKKRCISPREKSELGRDSVNMVDKDYVDFLEMLKGDMDYYAESGEYCLDHSPAEDVENGDDDIVDPDYKIFLDNVKEDGYSYALEMEKQDGTKVFLKYDEKDENPYMDTEKYENPYMYTEKVENTYEDTEKDENRYEDTEKDENLYHYSGKEERHRGLKPKIEPMDDDSEKENHPLVWKPDLTISHWFLSDCKPGTISSADESYLTFLDHVWVQGDCLIYKKGDIIVRYGDDDNALTDVGKSGETVRSQGNEMRLTPNTNLPIQNMDVNQDDSDSVQILGDESVKIHYTKKLEMKLRDVLSKPFNRKELDEKLEAARDRKPLERLKVMRGCDKWCSTGQIGRSYLDRHHDLDKLISSALMEGVPQRALSLLRCLFFYYENMPHQGSFKPWKNNPPTWLHNIICSCQEEHVKCPMKYRGSHEKIRHS